jgi:lauroyl/myristoyl acyltransferase
MRPTLAALLGSATGWKARVRRSMTAALGADGFTERDVESYFRRLADQIAFSAVMFRSGAQAPELQGQWALDPASEELYQTALSLGKGVLMAAPHLACSEVVVSGMARQIPVAVLARKSPDAEYEALKAEWYSKLGVEVIHRPRRDSELQGLAEMTALIRALRKNRVLALTPDLIRKPGTGVLVRLFERTVELPAGPFFLAVRTGAPLMPSFFHSEEGRYRLWSHPPIEVDLTADRDAAVAAAAQRWTDYFEAFVREHPDMWQFWLDKRWERWLAETPRSDD